MISGIGQIGVGYGPLNVSGSVDASLPPLLPGAAQDTNAVGLLKRAPEETIRAGFGQGSVSIPGAVKRTIDKNMQGAKRLSAWEAAQAKRAANRQTQTPPTGKEGLAIIAAMNRSANVAEARLAGEKPDSGPITATLAVNGQTMPYLATAWQAPRAETIASQLDINV